MPKLPRFGLLLTALRRGLPFILVAAALVGVGYVRERGIRAEVAHAQADLVASRAAEDSLARRVSDLERTAALNASEGLTVRVERLESALEATVEQLVKGSTAMGRRMTALELQMLDKLSLIDLQRALSLGQVNVNPAYIQVPIGCSGEVALWRYVSGGLNC